ncbi:extracellular solute-binding protein [Candidatus Aerophobetes bacterium]|nr:extracellular solute-binding protein [Candidatus Aerophobetes bacterium]
MKKKIVSCFLMSIIVLTMGGVSLAAEKRTLRVIFHDTRYKLMPREEAIHSGAFYEPIDEVMRTMIEYLHPTVKIEGLSYSIWAEGATQKILAAIAGGEPLAYYPTVKIGGIRTAIAKGLCADITEWVEADPMVKTLDKRLTKAAWKDGRCYAIPTNNYHSDVIGYRKDFFKEAGFFDGRGIPGPPDNWTWDDFIQIARKLTDPKKKRWGFELEAGEGAWDLYYLVAMTYGIPTPLMKPDPSGKYTWKAAFNAPEALKPLQLYKDLAFKYKCVLTGVEATTFTAREDMHAGRVAMRLASDMHMTLRNWGHPHRYGEDKLTLHIEGIAPLPTGPDGVLVNTCKVDFKAINPALSKEQQKAAFDWIILSEAGIGRLLKRLVYGGFLEKPDWGFGFEPYKVPNVPYVKPIEEALASLAPDYLRVRKIQKELPYMPAPFEYGLEEENKLAFDKCVLAAIQSVVTDPECDIQKVADEQAAIANKSALNYKVEGTGKENFLKYYKALGDFYKKYFPKAYKNVFSVLDEKYYSGALK